jgi:UDP-N-acetylglucosamine diphosphorylase/glucosamine-1-phosphate N-acetyltransferase
MNTNLIFFDNDDRDHLLPLTFTRPMAELRVGVLTIREKWERYLGGEGSFITQDYLSQRFPLKISSDNIVINAGVLPNPELVLLISELEVNEALMHQGDLIAARMNEAQFQRLLSDEDIDELAGYELSESSWMQVRRPWELFTMNSAAVEADYHLLTSGRESQPLSQTNRLIGDPGSVFLEDGASVEYATINTTQGPVYIGKGATVMEGSLIRGALALCEGAQLKMGAKVYGPTTIGPWCKVGGEVNNIVMLGYSNKGHDGFLGNAVVGEWCNLGADTNNSNLKNTYEEVRLWSYADQKFSPTGLQFCGLIMGDHSKCGINTMFNTGTVVGVFTNVFGSGFPRNFIPSFSWGGASGLSTYRFDKAIVTAPRVMDRRGVEFTDADEEVLRHIFKETAVNRVWEKKDDE